MANFASTADTAEKKVSFDEIGHGLFAYTAEGDPNSGIIVGDDAVMVVDAQATPVMAIDVIARVRTVTDKPIKYVVLTHYHACACSELLFGCRIIASDRAQDGSSSAASRLESEIGVPAPVPPVGRARPGPGRDHLRSSSRSGSAGAGLRRHIGRGHTAGDLIAWCRMPKVFPGTSSNIIGLLYGGAIHDCRARSTGSPNSRPRRWCRAGAPPSARPTRSSTASP